MHVLMTAVGSAGDVHPFIALGEALRRRGHAVELMTSPWFAERITAAGLGFIPAGAADDYERLVQLPDLWHPRRGMTLLLRELAPRLEAAYATALAHRRADTVLVGSTLAWNLRLLHDTHALPMATVHLSPTCILSAIAPASRPGFGLLDHLPRPVVGGLQWLGERLLLDPLITPELNRLRNRLGLAPVRRVLGRWMHAPQRVIGAWPAWFAPPQADWPTQTIVTGFPRWTQPGPAQRDAALDAFLDAGPPPVGITPGSAMAHGRAFFAQAHAACRALGRRALFITPYADQLPPDTRPHDAHHVAYAPFEQLVPRLAALVHHGGIGTCAQAFAAGVPQLVCPFAHDQFDNAARVQRLGAGRAVRIGASTARWTAALAGTVDDPAVRERCAAWQAAVERDGDIAERMADAVEALRGEHRAVPGT